MMNRSVISFILVLLLAAGCDSGVMTEAEGPEAASHAYGKKGHKKVSSTTLSVFQAAGDIGGGVLTPGDVFPPTGVNMSKLIRTRDFIQFTIQTSGLPQGAYTVWIVVINKPEKCLTSPCTDVDVFERSDIVDSSVYWADGSVVYSSGHGYFKARVDKGYFPTDIDQVGWPGSGLQNPMGGEFHLIVKYHGPASSDPDVLRDQLYTLLGSCDSGANGVDLGEFGIHCFDPQVAVHVP